MRVLYILNSDFGVHNTYGRRALPIAKESKKRNFEIDIICRGFDPKYLQEYNISQCFKFSREIMRIFSAMDIYMSDKVPLDLNKIKNDIFEFFLIKKLKKMDLKKYDIIHSWEYLPNAYKYIKKVNPNIKIIQDVAIALPNVLKKINNSKILFKNMPLDTPDYIKESLQYIDLFLSPSNFVKKSLMNEGIQKHRIVVIPFGVDLNNFKPSKDKDYYHSFNVAFCGSICNRKGIPYLIKAWKELNLKDATLNLYGRLHSEVSDLFKDADKYNIKIQGFIKNINEELPKNHIYVFPSLMEGSSKSIYEAMACELPVITTENSGSIIEDGVEGFIVPIQDHKSIMEKILYFYENREEIKKFGDRARKKVINYTWENYANNVVNCYDKVMLN